MKLFDTKQAIENIRRDGESYKKGLSGSIDRAIEDAVHRLEVQARTIAALPADLSVLLEKASAIITEEIGRSYRPYHSQEAVEKAGPLVGVQFDAIHAQHQNGFQFRVEIPRGAFGNPIKLPPKPHRMIILFMPIEDQKP